MAASFDHFPAAVEFVLRNEGGFADDPKDRGGVTNMGISSRHNPDVDVRSLSRAQAIELYRQRYWIRYRLNEIENQHVAIKVFDLTVWMGPSVAASILQLAINAAAGRTLVTVDGIIGSQTLTALRQVDPGSVVAVMRALALGRVHQIIQRDPSQERFRRGWERRALL